MPTWSLHSRCSHFSPLYKYQKNWIISWSAKGKPASDVLKLMILKASQNQMTFKVSEPGIFIKVDPCLYSSQFSIEEADDKFSKSAIVQKSATNCRFPPTGILNVQWTENVSKDTVSETGGTNY